MSRVNKPKFIYSKA